MEIEMKYSNPSPINYTRLYEASIAGDVNTLSLLIQEDPLILTRLTPTFSRENPLHIAALHNHFNYAEALLRYHPPLAKEVDEWGNTPFHVASAKGHVETVRVLLAAQDEIDTCLMRNSEGKLPLHMALMKRQRDVVRELVRAHPGAVREEVDRGGQNAAHLCVWCNYLEGLRVIVEMMDDDGEFLASVDEDGNTILHLAAAFKHLQIVEYIIAMEKGKKMGKELNKKGLTALDMAENSIPRDLQDFQVTNFLIKAGIARGSGRDTPTVVIDTNSREAETTAPNKRREQMMMRALRLIGCCIAKFTRCLWNTDEQWVSDMRGWLMVVAILALTVSFQAGVQPPKATDVLFLTFNTYAFILSASVILIIVSGSALNNKFCIWILVLCIWGILTFLTLAYSEALLVVDVTPHTDQTGSSFYAYSRLPHTYGITLYIWFLMLGGVMIYRLLILVVWLVRMLCRFIIYLRRNRPTTGH